MLHPRLPNKHLICIMCMKTYLFQTRQFDHDQPSSYLSQLLMKKETFLSIFHNSQNAMIDLASLQKNLFAGVIS